jgi:hypothetical protein
LFLVVAGMDTPGSVDPNSVRYLKDHEKIRYSYLHKGTLYTDYAFVRHEKIPLYFNDPTVIVRCWSSYPQLNIMMEDARISTITSGFCLFIGLCVVLISLYFSFRHKKAPKHSTSQQSKIVPLPV